MVTIAKYHTYGWHPYGKNYEMDSIFFHLGEPWYLSVIIDEYRGATLSIGELGMRNVVSLHCDSERVSHRFAQILSLQATVLYTSTLTVKKTCMSWASTFCTRCCSPSRFMLAAQSSCWAICCRTVSIPCKPFWWCWWWMHGKMMWSIVAGTLCYMLLIRIWLHTFLHQHKGDETQEKGVGGLLLKAMGYYTW